MNMYHPSIITTWEPDLLVHDLDPDDVKHNKDYLPILV